MILTCPECATGYFVDDAQIRAGGRTVRCAHCGARWTAHPETPLELSQPAEEATAEPSGESADQAAALTADDLPRAFRSRAEEERRLRQAAITGAKWAGAVVLVAAIGLAAVLARESVVGVWPQSASLYAAIGFPVNPVGLVIEDVKAEPALQQGHATLVVSGVIRNVEDHPVTAPPLRISLLNQQHRRVAGQIAALAGPAIPAGDSRRFATALVDPPFSAQDLEVDFAVGAKVQPPPARALAASSSGPTPSFDLRGSAGRAQPPAANAAAIPAAANAVPAPTNAAAAPHG